MATCLLVAGAQAGTRVLHFPRDQYVGSLHVEDPCLGSEAMELGRDLSLPYGLRPDGLALGGDWDFVGLAQGDARVPAGRNVKLLVMLRLPQDRNQLAALPALSYQLHVRDRCRQDPEDLSGLSMLDPNDLWGIVANRLIPTNRAGEQILNPISRLTGLRVLQLHGTGVTDKDMEYLRPLRSLGALEFAGELSLGNRGLAVLKNLRKVHFALAWIKPEAAAYGDDLARRLAEMTALESVKGVAFLSAEGMKALATLPRLRCLHVALKERRQGYDGPTGLSELAGMRSLEELFFTGGKWLSDADLADLSSVTSLKRLLLSGDEITSEGMASLGKLKQLEYLHVSMAGVTKRGLMQLKDLRNLETLYVRVHPDTRPAIDEVPLDLSTLKSLKTLDLAGFALQEGDLAGLSGLHHLEWMILQNNDLPETTLKYLKDLPALKHLTINGVQCSDGSGLASLDGLTGLRDLTLRGRVTDRAFSRLASVSSAWSLSAWTNEPIRPATIEQLRRTLPNIEYIHIHPLPDLDRQAPGASSPQRERGRPSRQNPRRGR